MRTTTLRVSVSGDDHDDLVRTAEREILRFLGSDSADDDDESGFDDGDVFETASVDLPSYELEVFPNEDGSDRRYTASVTARFKNV